MRIKYQQRFMILVKSQHIQVNLFKLKKEMQPATISIIKYFHQNTKNQQYSYKDFGDSDNTWREALTKNSYKTYHRQINAINFKTVYYSK